MQIRIATRDGHLDVEATPIVGAEDVLAVNRTIEEDRWLGEYVLTHVPTGMRVIRFDDEASALACGKVLWRKLTVAEREAWRSKEPETPAANTRPAIFRWLSKQGRGR